MRYREPLLQVALLLAALLACEEAKDKPKPPSPITVSAVDITRDYATMSLTAADAKWTGKDIKVTGIGFVTMGCQEDTMARAFSGEHKPTDEIHCLMLEGYDRGGNQALLWLRTWLASPPTKSPIQPGTSVTLRCHVPDDAAAVGPLDLSVEDCAILSAGTTATRAPRTPPPSGPAPKRPTRKK